MTKLTAFLKLSVAAGAGAAVLATSTPAIAAITYNLKGVRFDDNGELTGSFDFDGSNYSQIDITSFIEFMGIQASTGIYDDSSTIAVGTATVLQLEVAGDGNTLRLEFQSALTGTPGESIIINGGFEEVGFGDINRLISTGAVQAVPFDANVLPGIVAIGAVVGGLKLRRHWQKAQLERSDRQ